MSIKETINNIYDLLDKGWIRCMSCELWAHTQLQGKTVRVKMTLIFVSNLTALIESIKFKLFIIGFGVKFIATPSYPTYGTSRGKFTFQHYSRLIPQNISLIHYILYLRRISQPI